MTIDSPARFLLILSVHAKLVRAALVTRELRVASSAQQTFQIANDEFDPAEVWYKTKRVIAACLDIGRTQTREIAGMALVTQDAEQVEWQVENQEIVARGKMIQEDFSASHSSHDIWRGTLSIWLLWNLTGDLEISDVQGFPKTRARAPFDAEIPTVAVLNETEARGEMFDADVLEADRAILGTARRAWKLIF